MHIQNFIFCEISVIFCEISVIFCEISVIFCEIPSLAFMWEISALRTTRDLRWRPGTPYGTKKKRSSTLRVYLGDYTSVRDVLQHSL